MLKSELDKPPWKQVISPVPQIEQFKIDTSWEFLLVATDGVRIFLVLKIFFAPTTFGCLLCLAKVWDAVTNNEAINFVKSKMENRYKLVENIIVTEKYVHIT